MLGTEGYSPRILEKAVRQAAKASSFQDASGDLQELAGIRISATELQRLCGRIGGEWAQQRDQEVQAFRDQQLACAYAAAPQAAAVMLDGGRVQTRAEESGRGVKEPAWRETKVAWARESRSASVSRASSAGRDTASAESFAMSASL